MDFSQYQKQARNYDFTQTKYVALLGLIGEVGEINSVVKKRYRDKSRYTRFREDLRQEIGDTLWYLCSVCNHYELKLEEIATKILRETVDFPKTHRCKKFNKFQEKVEKAISEDSEKKFPAQIRGISGLNKNSANLYQLCTQPRKKETIAFKNKLTKEIGDTLWYLAHICVLNGLKMELVAYENTSKIINLHDEGEVMEFDSEFEDHERFPRKLYINICIDDESKETEIKTHPEGIKIGNSLNDNSSDEDFYRYHDVFHLSYMAVLGWSPVMRKLLDLKRRSCAETDTNEDGARANILEELLSLYVFEHAKEHDYYEGVGSLDLSLLKKIKLLTQNVEVSSCTHRQWENAILSGFAVYRALKENGTGFVVLDLDKPSISYSSVDPTQ